MIADIIETIADATRAHREQGTEATREALEQCGVALHVLGGAALMGKVFDALIDRKGWDAGHGISAAWQDVPGWSEL